jgi:hypothetical protein
VLRPFTVSAAPSPCSVRCVAFRASTKSCGLGASGSSPCGLPAAIVTCVSCCLPCLPSNGIQIETLLLLLSGLLLESLTVLAVFHWLSFLMLCFPQLVAMDACMAAVILCARSPSVGAAVWSARLSSVSSCVRCVTCPGGSCQGVFCRFPKHPPPRPRPLPNSLPPPSCRVGGDPFVSIQSMPGCSIDKRAAAKSLRTSLALRCPLFLAKLQLWP